MLNERLLGVLSTKENVNLETLGFENIDTRKFQAIITPIEIAGERLGTLFIYKCNEQYDIDDIILCEYGTTVVGLEMLRAVNEESAEESRKVVFENVKKNYPVLVYELPGTESTDATDKEEAKKVVKLIDALGTITKDSKEAVQKARNAYDKLTANDKVYVTNYDKLKKAEEKLQKLQKNSKE